MINEFNVGFQFRSAVEQVPDLPAIVHEDTIITFDQLWRLVETFAYKMAEHGVSQDSVVDVRTADSVVNIACVFAAACLGAQFTQNSDKMLNKENVSLTHIFATSRDDLLSEFQCVYIDANWSPATNSADAVSANLLKGFKSPDAPFFIVQTTEITGYPRVLSLTAKNISDRCATGRIKLVEPNTPVCILYPQTDFNYVNTAIAALLNKCTIVESTDAEYRRRSGVDVFFGAKFQMSKVLPLIGDHSRLKSAIITGARLKDFEISQYLERFNQVNELFSTVETGDVFANSYVLEDRGPAANPRLLSGEFELANDTDSETNNVLRVRSNAMSNEYLSTDNYMEGRLRDGWFYCDQTAQISETGALDFQSSNPDLINIDGRCISADIIDKIIGLANGVVEAACFMNPKPNAIDEIFVFAVFDKDLSPLQVRQSVKYICKKRLGVLFVPRVINPIDHIPRLSDGRADRHLCQEMVLNYAEEE